jgi:hypothetical protein
MHNCPTIRPLQLKAERAVSAGSNCIGTLKVGLLPALEHRIRPLQLPAAKDLLQRAELVSGSYCIGTPNEDGIPVASGV